MYAFPLCCVGHCLLLSSQLHRITCKDLSAAPVGTHPLQVLYHLRDCPVSEPLRKIILNVAGLLGFREISLAPPPRLSEGSGSTTVTFGRARRKEC